MKSIIRTAVIFSLMAIGIAVFAKEGNGHKGHGRSKGKNIAKHIEKIKGELGLTESQSAQIRSIIEASKAEIKADIQAMKNAEGKEAKAAARAELKKDQQAMRDNILAVLTPEQRAKAEEMRGMFKDKMKKKHDKKHKRDKDADDDDDNDVDDDNTGTPKQGGTTPPQGGTGKTGGGGQGKTKN